MGDRYFDLANFTINNELDPRTSASSSTTTSARRPAPRSSPRWR